MATRFMRGMYGVCQRKVRHATRAAAEKAAERLRRDGGRKLRVYHCDRCDGWHVGHTVAKAG